MKMLRGDSAHYSLAALVKEAKPTCSGKDACGCGRQVQRAADLLKRTGCTLSSIGGVVAQIADDEKMDDTKEPERLKIDDVAGSLGRSSIVTDVRGSSRGAMIRKRLSSRRRRRYRVCSPRVTVATTAR